MSEISVVGLHKFHCIYINQYQIPFDGVPFPPCAFCCALAGTGLFAPPFALALSGLPLALAGLSLALPGLLLALPFGDFFPCDVS
jgi:hypothetical protein